jgi:hypothetical protein
VNIAFLNSISAWTEQDEFAITKITRSTSTIAPPKSQEWQKRLRDLFARAAPRIDSIAFFNRGKTSLTNAILGSDGLRIGIIPLTSVITTVSYGTKEQVVLKYDKRILIQEVPVDALQEYVT